MWEDIRLINNVKNKKSSNHQTITDDLTISNHFDNIFTSVAKNIVSKIPKTLKSFDSYLKSSNENSFFLSPTIKEDVEDILSTLKINKAADPGTFVTRILEDYKNTYLNEYLILSVYLFNQVPFQKLLNKPG